MPPIQKKSFSVKTFWKEILAIFVLLLAFYFFRSQEAEIKSIIPRLEAANLKWTLSGVLASLVYVLLQSGMYITSFHSVKVELSFPDALDLFLKRNFLSVFLPVGGVSSLAYTPLRLQKKKVNSAQGTQASIIYAYVGILTVFIIGVPIILFSLTHLQTLESAVFGLFLTGAILVLLVFVLRSFTQKGRIYHLIQKKSPSVCNQLEGLFSEKVDKMQLAYTIGISLLIEVVGIVMVFVSMKALGMQTSIEISAFIYIVSVLSMLASPLLHGLGAVEFSMAYFFTKYGYPTSIALGATILYRVFEFWLPLLLGMVAFLWNGKNLIGRILPAAGIFFLGAVNIISVMKISLAARLQWELNYLPMDSMHVSKMMILFLGIALVLVSANLLKGHKSAFILALVLTIVSIFGQLIRAIHYEEAFLAFIILTLLVIYRKEYRIKSDKKWLTIGFRSFLIAFGAIFLFDCIGFYLLEKRHFGIDFTWLQSIEYTFKSFFLLSYEDLVPNSHFAREFLSIVHSLAFGMWLFLLVTVFRVRKVKEIEKAEEVQSQAEEIVQTAGKSAMDFFKLSRDKSFFMLPEKNALVSYRVANGFAVVLEEPVCEVSEKTNVIREFEKYCLKSGLKTFYYRVGEESLSYFKPFNKKKALLGQEAILDINQFSLSGSDRKSLRNGQNVLQKKGFVTEICTPPHSEEFLAALQDVSNEWLEKFKKQESIFSEGMFDLKELKKEKVVVVWDTEGKILAFLNIIPDYAPDECTYDMLRKTVDAVNGCEDALLIKLIEYAREKGYKYLNLGMASFTGITNPENTPEQLAKYASSTFKSLQHFHGLRNFKEKYATLWLNKYLVYNNDYDLWSIPLTIAKVMKPSKKN